MRLVLLQIAVPGKSNSGSRKGLLSDVISPILMQKSRLIHINLFQVYEAHSLSIFLGPFVMVCLLVIADEVR